MKTLFTIFSICFSLALYPQDYEIYVSDAGNFNLGPWQILKFDADGQNPITFIDDNINWPQDILFLEDSNLVLISNFGTNKITKHNATTGEYIGDFATLIAGPTRMKIGPDSLLYVLQWSGNGNVKRFNLDGSFVDNFTSFGVIQSIGIDWDEESNLYVSSYQSDDVRKFDIEGNDLGLFINSDLAGPTNIFFDSNGDLLVLDYDGTSVKRFDSNGDLIGDFITGLDNCEGYAHLPDGNILIGNGGSSSVKLFDSNGDYIEDLISSGSGNLINPNAIVIREMVVNSIPEPHVNEMAILLPSFGTAFSVNPKLLAAKNGIKVYSLSGEFICSIKYDTWNANDIPSGSYIISVLLENSLLTQKIIIEK